MRQVLGLDQQAPIADSTPARAGVFHLLVRHFFGRFFDKESLAPQGEPEAGVIQTLGILAAPSAFFVILFRPLLIAGWDLVAVRYMFVAFSMIVMGFIMVFEWGALLPDRRDYQVLTPLPVRLSTLFLAKAAALGIFLAIFLVDINFFGVLFWPGIDTGSDVAAILAAHLTAVVAGGLFAALAIGALQGLLVTFLRGSAFRRISVSIQTLLMAGLVMLLFLTPMLGFMIRPLVRSGSPLLYYFPGFWFVGLYEQLRPATRDPVLLDLGRLALQALCGAAAVFLLTYMPGYRRHARKVLETPEPRPAGPGRLRAWTARALDTMLLHNPVERAIFHFISQTITRSMKHRLFLATYGGFGAALAVMTVGSGPSGLLQLPLTLSFILVSGLRAAFNFPSELPANWAFQTGEVSSVESYLAGTRKWIVVCAILPLFALLTPMEFACFAPAAALFHLAFGITLSVLLMAILFLGFRKVPFTCAHFPGKVNLTGLGVIYIFGFTMFSRTMAALESWLLKNPGAAVVFFAGAAAAWLLLARGNRRMAAGEGELDYLDPGHPVVRTLGLSEK